ncbi:MAG: SdrD B-like domain-containing protein, partial [Candidatus Korobacteraceae bacterium]
MNTSYRIFLATILMFVVIPSALLADGNEVLGPPPASFPVSGGSKIAVGGAGLATQPGNIQVTVPAGATIRQVILYWAGRGAGDDTVTVSGAGVPDTPVTGNQIGTAEVAFGPRFAYRADVTNLGLVSAGGASTITVKDSAFGDEDDGTGMMVIYDDAADTISDLQLRDGADFAFRGNPENANDPQLCCTVKQTFSFTPRTFDRTATTSNFFASVQGVLSQGGAQRPNTVVVEVSNGSNTLTTEFVNQLTSNAGDEWDVFVRDVNVPAGYNSVSVQAFSDDRANTGGGVASLLWVASGFAVPSACLGRIGDFVWEDTNANGVQDAGETGIPGVTLTLTHPDSSTSTTTTNASGGYLFSGLCAGAYSVAVTAGVPPGLNPTLSFQGNPATDSNASPANVTLLEDDSEDLTIDFGYVAAPACNL